MNMEQDVRNRRNFIKKAGAATIAAGAVSLSSLFSDSAKADDDKDAIKKHWEKNQKKFEVIETQNREKYKAFSSPPKYIYRGTDYTDSKATFYAPLMEECKFLPEFQSIFSEGTAGQYFRHTMKFGMKDIIRFHGHSCEALYYTAAICRLICDQLFPDKVVDRTILRSIGGKSPCIGDSLIYITGGRFQFGTFNLEASLGHAIVLQRIDTLETWMGAWKDGVQSWNATKIFGTPNKANPLPYKRWSAWKHEPDTPKSQLKDCKIKWKYKNPELLKRLRDLKDNLKYLPKGVAPTVKVNEIREEFNWLQYRHLREVFSHPLEESFQIKKVKNFKWQYPHCEPMWSPRLDQKAKWASCMEHPVMCE